MNRNKYTSKLTERLETKYDSKLRRFQRCTMISTLVQDIGICDDENVKICFFDQSSSNSKGKKTFRLNKKSLKNKNLSNADNSTSSN